MLGGKVTFQSQSNRVNAFGVPMQLVLAMQLSTNVWPTGSRADYFVRCLFHYQRLMQRFANQ
jgi:hypothetical protein